MTDTTNNNMCKSLNSATTTIDVSAATAPSINQSLIATFSTHATWQTPSHTNLSSIGSYTHATIDNFINNFSLANGIYKAQLAVSQNTSINTTYLDGTDGYVLYINNAGTTIFPIISYTFGANGTSPNYVSHTPSISGGSTAQTYYRLNVNLGSAYSIYQVYLNITLGYYGGVNTTT